MRCKGALSCPKLPSISDVVPETPIYFQKTLDSRKPDHADFPETPRPLRFENLFDRASQEGVHWRETDLPLPRSPL